jgi:hypothetical protein
MHARIDRREGPPQSMVRQQTGRDGLAAAKRPLQFLPHGRSLPTVTDIHGPDWADLCTDAP